MLHDSMNILFDNVEKKVIIQADDARDNDLRNCLHFGFFELLVLLVLHCYRNGAA